MSTVIALFGKSCVGKSEVAQKLANLLNLPVRHCGEIVKRRAGQLGVSSGELPNAEHQAIDDETIRLVVECNDGIVVEGNFLDLVLQGFPDFILIQLICEDDERAKRFAARSSNSTTLDARDSADIRFRTEFYEHTDSQPEKAFCVDTTHHTSVEVASLIVEILRSHDQTKHPPSISSDDRR